MWYNEARRHNIMIDDYAAKRYCSEPLENIENYDKAMADSKHTWHCHHRNEISEANSTRLDGGVTFREQLIADGMYWNRPACELIFLLPSEHARLHKTHIHPESIKRFVSKMAGRPGRRLSQEEIENLRRINTGKHHTQETRNKISAAFRNREDCSKQVEGTSPTGEVRVFPSTQEAARWLRKNGHQKAANNGIALCALGRQRTSYGFVWRYV